MVQRSPIRNFSSLVTIALHFRSCAFFHALVDCHSLEMLGKGELKYLGPQDNIRACCYVGLGSLSRGAHDEDDSDNATVA